MRIYLHDYSGCREFRQHEKGKNPTCPPFIVQERWQQARRRCYTFPVRWFCIPGICQTLHRSINDFAWIVSLPILLTEPLRSIVDQMHISSAHSPARAAAQPCLKFLQQVISGPFILEPEIIKAGFFWRQIPATELPVDD